MNPQTQISNGKIEKSKGWFELTSDEKIERLREVIKQKQYFENRVYSLENSLRKMRKLIVSHKHIDGKTLQEVSEYEDIGENSVGALMPKSIDEKEVYF
jgi:hypothetical protein